ncbi:MAG: hypothetical protein ACRCV5_06345 [Afipia sp.]
MSTSQPTDEAAVVIFAAIEKDLRDRRGLKHEWGGIDPEIQQEIRDTNIKVIARILTRFGLAHARQGEIPKESTVLMPMTMYAEDKRRVEKLVEAVKEAHHDKRCARTESLRNECDCFKSLITSFENGGV